MLCPGSLITYIFCSQEISNFSQTRVQKVQNSAVQIWPHQCWDKRINHFPHFAGYTLPNTAQYAMSFQHHQTTHQLNVLLPGNPGSCPEEPRPTQPTHMQLVPQSQRQDFASVLVDNSWKWQVLSPTLQHHSPSTWWLVIPLIRVSSLTCKVFLICQFRRSIPTRTLSVQQIAIFWHLSDGKFPAGCLLPRTYW